MQSVFGILRQFLQKRRHNLEQKRRVGLTWMKVKWLKHDQSKAIKRHKLFGHDFYYVASQDFLHALSEIFVDECYKSKLGKEPFILDCGANIGLSTLYFSKEYPDAKIISFEPDKVNLELLEKNVRSFGLNNVQIRNEAVWNEHTTLQFQGEGSLGSFVAQKATTGSYEVPAISLNSLLNQHVDLLKLDIEGSEYEVMKDIEAKLHLVENIFLEYHSTFEEENKLIELLGILKNAGFYFYMREVFAIYPTPFYDRKRFANYDIQLNIYCFRQ